MTIFVVVATGVGWSLWEHYITITVVVQVSPRSNDPAYLIYSPFSLQLVNLEGNLQNMKVHLTKSEGSRKDINEQVSDVPPLIRRMIFCVCLLE